METGALKWVRVRGIQRHGAKGSARSRIISLVFRMERKAQDQKYGVDGAQFRGKDCAAKRISWYRIVNCEARQSQERGGSEEGEAYVRVVPINAEEVALLTLTMPSKSCAMSAKYANKYVLVHS